MSHSHTQTHTFIIHLHVRIKCKLTQTIDFNKLQLCSVLTCPEFSVAKPRIRLSREFVLVLPLLSFPPSRALSPSLYIITLALPDSLCRPGCLQIHRDPPASASLAVRTKEWRQLTLRSGALSETPQAAFSGGMGQCSKPPWLSQAIFPVQWEVRGAQRCPLV